MDNDTFSRNRSLKIKGLGVALITPFTGNNTIDFDSLSSLIEFQIKNKVDFFVLLGTTGETPTLSSDEKTEICNFVKKKVNGRIPIVIGIGGNCTHKVIKEIETTDLDGFSAVLSVTPFYNKPTQEGLYLHFKNISENSPLPIIIYNVPGRTGVNISADTTLKLAENCLNIIAIKEASGNIEQIERIIRNKPENFQVYSGDDALGLELVSKGADGVISVIGNAFPYEYGKMIRLAAEGKNAEAILINKSLESLYPLLFCEGNPAGIKSVLHSKGMCNNILRLPLVPVSIETDNRISQIINH